MSLLLNIPNEIRAALPLSFIYKGILDDYKIYENGQIKLAQQTSDTFDRLILVHGKKGKIFFTKKTKQLQNAHLIVKKGVLDLAKKLKGRSRKHHFKGLKLTFQQDSNSAQQVFEFLADHTFVEWSLLSFKIEGKTRTSIYTSYRNDVEFFGSLRVHHLIHCPLTITHLKHYHNHPRTPVEAIGKYAFPSNSDLDFRNNVIKKGIPNLIFKIRTDGRYIDYGNPKEWNKSNGEDWM